MAAKAKRKLEHYDVLTLELPNKLIVRGNDKRVTYGDILNHVLISNELCKTLKQKLLNVRLRIQYFNSEEAEKIERENAPSEADEIHIRNLKKIPGVLFTTQSLPKTQQQEKLVK